MTTENNNEFYDLTFSQREGKSPLPEAMTLEHIPQRFRQLAWRSVDRAIDERSGDLSFDIDSYDPDEPIGIICEGIPRIIESYKFDILLKPHDEIAYPCPSKDKEFSRKIILSGEYHNTITFIEYILRHRECPDELYTSLASAFSETSSAYLVKEIGGKPTVIPRISREAGDATRRAIETIDEEGMDGASTHLRNAAEHIKARQYADAIVDSIHAVESVARIIDPKSSKTLGPALNSLEQTGVLNHAVLKQAFSKLYGYTNDEQGIRHALTDKDAADVGLDEAIFMFGACASFAAYLTQKHRQAGGT